MEKLGREFDTMLNWLKDKVLSAGVEKAILSTRLVESPCAIVATQYGYSGNMERIMKSQAYAKAGGADSGVGGQKKILEMNPFHPLVKELNRLHKEDEESDQAKDLAHALYDTALLRSGYTLKDSVKFSSRMDKLLRLSFNIDKDAKVEIPDEFDEELKEEEPAAAEEPAADETQEAAAPETEEKPKEEL